MAREEPGGVTVAPGDVLVHEATRALSAVCGTRLTVTGIECLTRGRKTRAYRLDVAGAPFRTLIARCKAYDDGETTLYRSLLPSAGLPTLEIYGELADVRSGSFWRFVEDAGDESVGESHEDQCLVARWLATLHTWRGLSRAAPTLPSRGPDHHLSELRSATEMIEANLSNSWLDEETRRALTAILRNLNHVERQWHRISDVCAEAPPTLVHGDFARKNARVRRTTEGRQLILLDWETAGVGPPAVDLAQNTLNSLTPDLECYAANSQPVWPTLTLDRVRALAAAGEIFRLIAAVDWQAGTLPDPRCTYAAIYQLYDARLEAAIAAHGWR